MYHYQKALLPPPKKINDRGGQRCLGSAQTAGCQLHLPETDSPVVISAAKILYSCFSGNPPVVAIDLILDAVKMPHPEGYCLEVDDERVRITAPDPAGLYYGAVTLEKLLHTENGQLYLPRTIIEDYPDFPERGLFLEDRYGSEFMALEDYREFIDYFSKMKYNSLTIGIYGCWEVQYDNRISQYLYVPISKYPQLRTPMSIKYYSAKEKRYVTEEFILPNMFREDFFGEVIRYAASKNITVRPLFNSFGHNTLLPSAFPNISARTADGALTSKGLCTSCEETFEILFSIYDELIDKYLLPNGIDSIHLGLDEVKANDICQCPSCAAQSFFDNAAHYTVRLLRYLKQKGMRHVHLYYDSLFGVFRTKLGRFVSSGGRVLTQEELDAFVEKTAELFRQEGVYDIAVLDWWSYQKSERQFYGRALNTSFRSVTKPMTGYYHWIGPMERLDSIKGCVQRAKALNYQGVEPYSSTEYCYDRAYQFNASLCWNTELLENTEHFFQSYAYQLCPTAPEDVYQALSILGNIEENDRKPCLLGKLSYYWSSYQRPGQPYPRCYFSEILEAMNADRPMWDSYLEQVREDAQKALAIIENSPIENALIKKNLIATAKHYSILPRCYQMLLTIHDGTLSQEETALLLQQLVDSYTQLILVAEETRPAFTLYQYARDLSIVRELCIHAQDMAQKDWEHFSLPYSEKIGSPRIWQLR